MSSAQEGKRVFLITSANRYWQYWMTAEGTEVVFFQKTKTERGALVHKLAEIHFATIDTADKKVLCDRHFGITL